MRSSLFFAFLAIALSHPRAVVALSLDLLGILEAALGITLGGNALININLNAGLLSGGACNAANQVIGISTDLLGLVSICACVTALAGTQSSGNGVTTYSTGLLGIKTPSGKQYSCGSVSSNPLWTRVECRKY